MLSYTYIYYIYTAADPGGLKTPRPWKEGLRSAMSVANITVKDNVYRPTSELVS